MARPAKKSTAKKTTARKTTAEKGAESAAPEATAKKAATKTTAAKTTAARTGARKTTVKQTREKARPSALAEAAGTRRRSTSDSKPRERRSSATPTKIPKHDQVSTKKGLAHRLYVGEASYDFIKNRKKWYIASAVILLVCLASLLLRGLNLGIEFKGGTTFNVPIAVNQHTINDVGQVVEGTGLPELGTSVVTLGDHTARVQVRSLSTDEVSTIRNALAKEAGTTPDKVAYSTVGASWGKQITEKGLQALIVFLVLVGLMIWAYFRDWKMSIAALVALLHDLLVTVGVYSLVGFTVSPATLIGVLTILGYSLYDTVVVFDKVRDNVKNIHKQDHTYSEQTNLAINQVLVRSLNTTLIGVLPVAALLIAAIFFMGPGPLEDLGLALFVGMIAGAYSSIFIAAPLNAQLREMEPEMKAHTAKLGRRDERHARGSKVGEDISKEAEDATQSGPEVVVNKIGDEEPWELEGVEVDDAAIAELEGAEDGPPQQVRTGASAAGTRRPTSNRRTTRSQRKK